MSDPELIARHRREIGRQVRSAARELTQAAERLEGIAARIETPGGMAADSLVADLLRELASGNYQAQSYSRAAVGELVQLAASQAGDQSI